MIQYLPIPYVVVLAITLILERKKRFGAAILSAITAGIGMAVFLFYGQEHHMSVVVLLLRGREDQVIRIGPVSFVLAGLLALVCWLAYLSYCYGESQVDQAKTEER